MLTEDILKNKICLPVAHRILRGAHFITSDIRFGLPDSHWHGVDHTLRVLIFTLVLGHRKGLRPDELETLSLAAAFHDTCRQDEWTDPGHGERAAYYYQRFCEEKGAEPDVMARFLMHYHDRDDSIGLARIAALHRPGERAVLLYQIFKDADALDRFRLAPDALDISQLRTREALELIPFSQQLLKTMTT
ncbi:HD domain-containing protein [Enterobacter cloacae complex sp. RIVM_C039474]|uniref:HD/PDEase domain-containing protein n=1 Tax=Enterobacter roggenkampii TaxID=1812935 RepID=A0A837LE20_9ENTR|nr:MULTISPECIES: HD domain-containing protein [Enterobacteriaceae]EGL2796183.1 hypothetical protein [Salmonella enterica]ELA1562113.1 HD domain-containing protein [Klebsiella pneumoniae]HDK6616689.1 HD domain-containing protein [Klebsiella variicola]EEH95968.2 hypothetical protein CSAG_04322 [Citrobacter portucalensis]EHF2823803.1 hypothetical protein [Salmonella enterica]